MNNQYLGTNLLFSAKKKTQRFKKLSQKFCRRKDKEDSIQKYGRLRISPCTKNELHLRGNCPKKVY